MTKSIVGSAWSEKENQATIEAYFGLFLADVRGERINKAATYRSLAERFGRYWKAYEFKMLNISAVLVRMQWPHLRGLLPRSNYQGSLEIAVAEHILQRDRSDFIGLDHPAPVVDSIGPADLIFRPAPDLLTGKLQRPDHPVVRAVQRDYASIEARNASLGLAGELMVAEAEERVLFQAGFKKLAARVEHVVATRGDGLGFDVLSFETNGKERHIEVKTSRYGAATPFYITDNEVKVSESTPESYWLYRLYDFPRHRNSGRHRAPAYRLRGNLRTALDLQPVNYRALPV